jgi:hypothetical protein
VSAETPRSPVSRGHIGTLRGVGRMAVDATTGLTDLVQALHTHIASGPTKLGGPLIGGAVNGITNLVYGSVRGATRAMGYGLDGLLHQVDDSLSALAEDEVRPPAGPPNRTREALLAALNGVLGDYLLDTGNPLAISMCLRHQGMPLTLTREALRSAYAAPSRHVIVLLHGLCMNDVQWTRDFPLVPAHDHGAALARDVGVTPLYLHYNSGLHVSLNGRALATLLESLVAAWPVEVEHLTLLGHSMGGLVARSAVHYASEAGHAWTRRLGALIFLGTPHHGAPLERGGHWIDLLLQSTGYTAPFARLGRIRSAGITDLRHGSTLDEDWHGRDRFARGKDTRRPVPLPARTACHAIAATTADAEAVASRLAVDPEMRADCLELPGDGLVPVASALGRHTEARHALGLTSGNCWIAPGSGHLDLLSSTEVYRRIRGWLAAAA